MLGSDPRIPERSSVWPLRVFGDPRFFGLTLRGDSSRTLAHPLNALWNARNDVRNVDWLYRLVRRYRPIRAVETGVYFGKSTVAILAALQRNDAGRLISIDMPVTPAQTHARTPKSIGKLVPASLSDRWELRLGDARQLLPPVLLEGVDFFLHDSDHTYGHMTFEYEAAWRALSIGGVLASDDTKWSSAWVEFLERHRDEYRPLPDGPAQHRAIRKGAGTVRNLALKP